MRKTHSSLLGLSVLIFLSAASAFAQSRSFSDPNVNFSFDLPDDNWKITVKPNAASPKTEVVYGDRRSGLLEIRKIDVTRADTMNDIITTDEQRYRQFLPGYVTGKVEQFSGRLRGSVANFEYVASGRNMSGRYYYLRAGDTAVYVLRFSGPPDGLRGLRVQTDQIARTFQAK